MMDNGAMEDETINYGLLFPWESNEEPFIKRYYSSFYCRKNANNNDVAQVFKRAGGRWGWWINQDSFDFLARRWHDGPPKYRGWEKRCTRAMKKVDAMLIFIGFKLVSQRLVVMK